ncbi:MAG: DpnD/PcfM family protein [Paraclostridium sp.]|uniref:DpnD/PcfM family protein n=1 Tax=Cetobacterium sp. TaxID=2071632 RepID=UPI003F2ED942
MKKFNCSIRETLEKNVEIEAKDEIEALKIVRKMYSDGEIVLDSENFISHEIKVEGEK